MHPAAPVLTESPTSALQRAWAGLLAGLGLSPRLGCRLSLQGKDIDSVALGQTVTMHYRLHPAHLRFNRVQILLQGVERATFRRGTEAITDESVFYRQVVAQFRGPSATNKGECALTIPASTMHSVQLAHNQVQWSLLLEAETAAGNIISTQQSLEVLPQCHH